MKDEERDHVSSEQERRERDRQEDERRKQEGGEVERRRGVYRGGVKRTIGGSHQSLELFSLGRGLWPWSGSYGNIRIGGRPAGKKGESLSAIAR